MEAGRVLYLYLSTHFMFDAVDLIAFSFFVWVDGVLQTLGHVTEKLHSERCTAVMLVCKCILCYILVYII